VKSWSLVQNKPHTSQKQRIGLFCTIQKEAIQCDRRKKGRRQSCALLAMYREAWQEAKGVELRGWRVTLLAYGGRRNAAWLPTEKGPLIIEWMEIRATDIHKKQIIVYFVFLLIDRNGQKTTTPLVMRNRMFRHG
jgi:hypothetical protein